MRQGRYVTGSNGRDVTVERAGRQAIDIAVPTMSQLAVVGSVLVVLLQFAGGTLGEAAAGIGVLGGAAIGWTARYRYLPVLVILSFPAFGLSIEQFPNLTQTVPLAGAGFAAPLAAMLAAACRTIIEAARPAAHRSGWPSRTPVFLFMIALVFAALGALVGRSSGLNAWSEGVRSVLAVGGLFWGFTMARKAGPSSYRIAPMLVTITVVGCALHAVALLRGHFLFLLVGTSAALLGYFIRERRLLALTLAGVVAGAGLALYTLTTAAIVSVAIGSLMLTRLPAGVLRRWIVGTAVAVAALASIAAIWAVLRYGETLGVQLALEAAGRDDLIAYAMLKLLSDRGALWLAAIQQISSGPYWIVPSGRPLYPLLGLYAGEEWLSGPHNSILQVLRNTGLIAGSAIIALMTIAMLSVTRVLARTSEPLIRAFAAAFLAIAASGIMTGDFPVTDIGFVIWALAGLTIGLYKTERTQSPSVAIASESTRHAVGDFTVT